MVLSIFFLFLLFFPPDIKDWYILSFYLLLLAGKCPGYAVELQGNSPERNLFPGSM